MRLLRTTAMVAALLPLGFAGSALAQSSLGASGTLSGSGDTPGSPGAHLARHRPQPVITTSTRARHLHSAPAIDPNSGQTSSGRQ